MTNPLFYTLETIDYQGKSRLALELIEEIKELQKLDRVGQVDLQESKISKIIKKHTNLNTKINIDVGMRAAIHPQVPSKDNVLFYDEVKTLFTNIEADKSILEKGKFDGVIDLKNSKVYGDFTKLLSEVYLGESLLNNKSIFTPEETVAFILHELGHFFVALELLTRVSKTNYVMENATRKLLDSETKEQRIAILDQIENIYNEKINNKKRVAEIKKHKNYYRVLILTVASNESINQLGYNIYDVRAYEQLSDQFSTRHGLGKDLVTGLDKIHREYSSYFRDYHSKGYHILMWVMNVITFALTGYFSFLIASENGILIFLIVSFIKTIFDSSPNRLVYDPPRKRFEKVKNDLVSALKDPKLSDKERDTILEDIEIIENIRKELHDDNFYFSELLWNNILPWGRDEVNKVHFNEELEKLLNNSLFLSSQHLQQHLRKS